jgi:hypothetical protein
VRGLRRTEALVVEELTYLPTSIDDLSTHCQISTGTYPMVEGIEQHLQGTRQLVSHGTAGSYWHQALVLQAPSLKSATSSIDHGPVPPADSHWPKAASNDPINPKTLAA